MDSLSASDTIRPLLISENRLPSEVRSHARRLAEDLAEWVRPEIANDRRPLFVFILRGAMLLYPPFAEKFENASFTFVSAGFHTELDCKDYDTVIIVDTVIETGKTVIGTKRLLADSGISAKRWFSVCVCANSSVKDRIAENFDGFFCREFLQNVNITVDAGKYAACGDGAQI